MTAPSGDPRIHAVATDAISDLIAEVGREAIADRQEELTLRLARAIQQAMEDEYGALVDELIP